jgi:hypothetical protein
MAGSVTDYFEKKLLDSVFRSGSLSLDATNLWLGLFTATPSDTGGGTEVSTSGTAYARQACNRTSGSSVWNAATGTLATTTNNTAITFPTATASWGTVTQFGIFDAVTAGNLLYWGDIPVSKTIGTNDIATFAATTGITITQD